VNKKKQKNFLTWTVLLARHGLKRSRSFLRRFFSKKRLLAGVFVEGDSRFSSTQNART
jgi:hypothetical protein